MAELCRGPHGKHREVRRELLATLIWGKKGRKHKMPLQAVGRDRISLEFKYRIMGGSTGEQEFKTDFHDSKKILQGERVRNGRGKAGSCSTWAHSSPLR